MCQIGERKPQPITEDILAHDGTVGWQRRSSVTDLPRIALEQLTGDDDVVVDEVLGGLALLVLPVVDQRCEPDAAPATRSEYVARSRGGA